MAYHIIPVIFSYHSRRVPCHERGRFHRHKTHIEEFCYAVCGQEVVRGRDDFCSISIATPDWNYAWCRECVESIDGWTPEAIQRWKARGFFQAKSA